MRHKMNKSNLKFLGWSLLRLFLSHEQNNVLYTDYMATYYGITLDLTFVSGKMRTDRVLSELLKFHMQ